MQPLNSVRQVQVAAPVRTNFDANGIIDHLAYRMGASVTHSLSTPVLRYAHTMFLVTLAVPDSWTEDDSSDFESRLVRALRHSQGVSWMSAAEILLMMDAEDAAGGNLEALDLIERIQRTPSKAALVASESLAARVGKVVEDETIRAVFRGFLATLYPPFALFFA